MSSLSGGGKCIKYLVFIFNFLFFLIGAGFLSIGIYAKVGKTKYMDLTEELTDMSKYLTAGNLFIAVGIIVMIVAFFGCCGAIKECTWMLMIFFILLVIIFIMEVAACIVGYTKRSDIEKQLRDDLKEAITNKYMNSSSTSAIKKAIDKFQRDFECCGYDGFEDWRNSKYHKATNKVPASCCMKNTTTQNCPTSDATVSQDVYNRKGCFKEVVEWFKNNMYIIGSSAIAFSVIQILGIVFSMMLYCNIKRAGTLA